MKMSLCQTCVIVCILAVGFIMTHPFALNIDAHPREADVVVIYHGSSCYPYGHFHSSYATMVIANVVIPHDPNNDHVMNIRNGSEDFCPCYPTYYH
jgi:hypothetical protein